MFIRFYLQRISEIAKRTFFLVLDLFAIRKFIENGELNFHRSYFLTKKKKIALQLMELSVGVELELFRLETEAILPQIFIKIITRRNFTTLDKG